MPKVIINGPSKLNGAVTVRGAKNATLPILIAAALSQQDITLDNVPTEFNDVHMTLSALEYIGCQVTKSDGSVKINASNIRESILPQIILLSTEVEEQVNRGIIRKGYLVFRRMKRFPRAVFVPQRIRSQ